MNKSDEKPFLLVFDFGEVVVRWDNNKFHEVIGELGGGTDMAKRNMPAFLKHTGMGTKPVELEETFPAACEHFTFRSDCTVEDFRKAWNAPLSRYPEMEALVSGLAPRYPMAVASNTNLEHWRHLEQLVPVIPAFSSIYTSHEMGLRKPDSAFYERLLLSEGYADDPHRVIFIDDLVENVDAANRIGMKGLVFTGRDQLVHDLTGLGVHVPLKFLVPVQKSVIEAPTHG